MSLTVIDKPKIDIDQSILNKLCSQVDEQGQVVLHFLFKASIFGGEKIRIWPTTYLYDNNSEYRAELVHQENISLAPHWTELEPSSATYFTLVFNGLPKSCLSFDFKEHCEGGGAFHAKAIRRNNSDVYFLRIG